MKVKSESEVAQLCPTLSDPMDCSLPGSSVHGIFQARVLEWGAIAFFEVYIHIYIHFSCHFLYSRDGHNIVNQLPFIKKLMYIKIAIKSIQELKG